MHVNINVSQDYNGLERHEITITHENKTSEIYIGALCECPEDAIIGRDLIDGFQILDLMRIAYEAGKNEEEFIVDQTKETRE